MIKKIGTITIFVKDQNRAKEFYTKKLGLKVASDNPLYEGAKARWLTVAPENAETQINLYLMDDNWKHYESATGKTQNITLNVENLQKFCTGLKSKGVEIIKEPEKQFWGTFAIIKDSEGNGLILVEI